MTRPSLGPPYPKRTVRSFVRRIGRRTAAQDHALATLWPRYGLTVEQGLCDLPALFGREALCTLEIGFGMGDAILALAERCPEENFIGVEVHPPGIGTVLNLLEKKALTNVRLYNADVKDVLQHCIPDASLQRILIFFPDPWPKKRHHKRRLIQTEFIAMAIAKLKPGGLLHLATDWQPYAEHMLSVLEQIPALTNLAGTGCYSERPSDRPLTKFERRGQILGHGVWDLLFQLNV